MAINRRRASVGYGITNALQSLAPEPIVAQRAPTTSDFAQPGTVWLDQSSGGDDVYILREVSANAAAWVACGSGAGVFDTLTVAGATTLSALGRGVVQSSAAGVLSSSEGTDGQLVIGSSAGAPDWASVTSGDGSVVIAVGNNTLDLTVSGATASTFPTDAGTATPVLGATTITGGTNVNTSGAADVVTINVDNAPTFSGLVTAQAGITQSAGTTTLTSDTNAADAIYLHADAGTNETIRLHADQGTGVGSVTLLSDVGGITLDSGLASNDAINLSASAGGVDIDGALQVTISSSQNAADALVLESTAGGIDIVATGSAGEDIDINSVGSSINLVATENAAEAIYLRANAGASETIHIHSDQGTGAASVYVHSDVGGITLDSGLASDDAINLTASVGGVDIDGALQVNIASSENAADALVLTASAGGIDILASGAAAGEDIDIIATGSSVNLQSTEADAAAIVLNASDAAGGVDVLAGSGDIDLTATLGNVNVTSTIDAAAAIYLHANGGTSETIHIHSDQGTGVASVYVHSDVGGVTLDSGLASDDAINLSASAGGVDIDGALQVNIASSEAAADALVLSVSDAAGGMQLNSSGNISDSIYLHADAGTAEKIRVHADQGTGVDSVALVSDVGGITLDSGLASDDAINLSASAGGVDVDAALQLNLASSEAAADAIVLSASDAAGGIDLTTGGGEITMDTGATGNIKLTPGTNSVAGVALTLNSKVGVATFTGQTTGSGAQETFTITNSEVSAGSGMIVTVSNQGANDARMSLEQVKTAAGSFEVMTQNNGGASLNGNCVISWIVLN